MRPIPGMTEADMEALARHTATDPPCLLCGRPDPGSAGVWCPGPGEQPVGYALCSDCLGTPGYLRRVESALKNNAGTT